MRELIKRLLARWVFWRKSLPKPTEIIGAEFLGDYQKHYAEFQKIFTGYIRENPDAAYWKDFKLIDIARIAGEWSYRKHWDLKERSDVSWEAHEVKPVPRASE